MSYKGFFKCRHPEKYVGNPKSIVYRSSWECKLMMYLDSHDSVIQWASEEIAIPYVSPIDNRQHKYFPDFWVKKRNKDNSIETCIIEVKPHKECKPPVQTRGKSRRRLIQEATTYEVNQAKWAAATEFCKRAGWKFKVFTEAELNILF